MTLRKRKRESSAWSLPGSDSIPSHPTDDFAISWYADGSVASTYGEFKWIYPPNTPAEKWRFLNFRYWGDSNEITARRRDLVAEIHWLFFLGVEYDSRATSFKGRQQRLITLRKLAVHCEDEELTICELLSDPSKLLRFVHVAPQYFSIQLISLCRMLARLGTEVTGYSVPGANSLGPLKEVAARFCQSVGQHPPLPTRIYSQVLSVLAEELSDFQKIAQNYLDLASRCSIDPLFGRYGNTKKALRRKEGGPIDPMPELLEQYGLTEYFKAKELTSAIQGLSHGLNRIMTISRLTIQAFSGMRDNEVQGLMYGCLEERIAQGRTHYVIHGVTTKLNKGKRKEARWITNEEGARAIKVARQITALNHDLFMRGKKNAATNERNVPLLASITYFKFSGKMPNAGGNNELMLAGFSVVQHSAYADLRKLLQPLIVEEDLAELEQIDLHRAWRSEQKFRLGQAWTFTTHQLRRSLALYAQRSGLVSLPSLRRQLQHIAEAMSRYYAKGSAFAQDFIGDYKEHFAHEWRETQPISSALSYINHALLTDDVLFGGHGNWIEHRLRDDNGEIEVDRERTLKRFKKGEIAYQETVLGGCTKTGPCDRRPVEWLNIDCINGCTHLVGQLRKLEHVIVVQKRLVASLDPLSRAYQSEKADLDLLVSVRDKVRAQSARGSAQ
ncbi:hypothetical protein [Paraburkholderia sediminicola]|uniref:hypothetical protein n=1 Tax=Paraburkholderia sediminicola TaxID=458836 RepID=UPI0038B7CA79